MKMHSPVEIELEQKLPPCHASASRDSHPARRSAEPSAELGVRILIKREDMTGLAFGGNKTRELDFFIGAALAEGADTFISGGGVAQSNHALQCSAAARRAGLLPVQVLHSFKSELNQGNLLLTRMIGADIRFVESHSIDDAIDRRDVLLDVMHEVADEYRRRQAPCPVFVVPLLGAALMLTQKG